MAALILAALVAAGSCFPLPGSAAPPDGTPSSELASKEYWDAHYFEDSKVGYSHTVFQPTTVDSRTMVRITSESELTLQRFGQTIRQRLEFNSLETPTGEVVSCSSKILNESPGTEAAAITAEGHVEGAQLLLRVSTLGKDQTAALPWNSSWGGFFAAEQTLERFPLRPGEKRRIHALVPGFNQTAEIEFAAVDFETTKLLEGPQQLLRIESKIKLGDNVLEQTVWTDPTGQTRKSFMPALKQTVYRTTREVALGRSNGAFDLGKRTVVPVKPALEGPHQKSRIHYRATLQRGDVSRAFARGATQAIKPIDGHTVEIAVRALRPGDPLGTEFPADVPPQPEDLAPNSLIQSDDPQVQQLSRQVAADRTNPWEIAIALEKFVQQHVANKGFAQALASAAEVVRSREGDCTEHAVLLAALCRAREVPARVAIGLVYSQAVGGFAYHMWTEVWIRDRWLPVDGTLGQGGIGAAHLKVASSSLKGVDPFSQFLPVFQLIGNLEIQVISSQ